MNKQRCYECSIKAGATPPKWNPALDGITISMGECDDCGETTGIVPASDFDWPKAGSKASFD